MSKENQSFDVQTTFNSDDLDDDDISTDGLEIDISEIPQSKNDINIEDKLVLDNIEEEIERQYDEKAAKSNLSAINVKNILRNVITNEHVWAMVRNTTEENVTEEENSVYEPKLTRAKAKELLKNKNVPVTAIPWANSKPNSDVHILINEELPEDSDDDEYVPPIRNEEESEDEKDSCKTSDIDSQPPTPATPTSTHDSSTQTNWTEDGIFKIPSSKSPAKGTTENIALRTRSKLSLSDTPLEIIEEAFVPPDITTDMYDLECDDDDWRDFLKKFTRPLDEAVTGMQEDDDEADPEYNVLADEELDKIDKEELRQDKGVKITKRELNNLVAELFEFSEIFSNVEEVENQNPNNFETINVPESNNINNIDNTAVTTSTINYNCEQVKQANEVDENIIFMDPQPLGMIYEQRLLFEQQLRQHVQLLTQNFFLTYKHPVLDHMAILFKNMLLSFEELSKYKKVSAFKSFNLSMCIYFIQEWENMIASNTKEVQEMLSFVTRIYNNGKAAAQKGNYEYIPTFPPLLLKKVTESQAFIYPSLLPKIPFRHYEKHRRCFYTRPENELIALGLEQFIPQMENKPHHRTRLGKVRLTDVAYYISKYMMPHKEPIKLQQHIRTKKTENKPNPINFYFVNKKAPTTVHYVVSLKDFGAMAPKMRHPSSLPYQWRVFLYPEIKFVSVPKPKRIQKSPTYKKPVKKKRISIIKHKSSENIDKTVEINNDNRSPKNIEVSESPNLETEDVNSKVVNSEKPSKLEKNKERFILPKIHEIYLTIPNEVRTIDKNKSETVCTVEQIAKISPEILNLKFNSSVFSKNIDANMLPSMPFLLTPLKEQKNLDVESSAIETEPETQPVKEIQLVENSKNEEVEKDKNESEKDSKKDDEDELNALMIASSTIQQKNRRLQPNLTKKAKQMKEYNATLAMLCPEDENVGEEKAKNYAQAYYEKVQERLENESPLEYEKFMKALSEHDESENSVSDLYEKVTAVLSPNHPDLCEEFLTFLTPEQAQQIGKLVPNFMLSNMSLFLRKLEIYYNNQPAQLRRIYNCLIELADIPDIAMDKVKSTILPLLKGNALLIDWFLQMFPQESPPESLMTNWEQINCDDEDVDNDEKIFETLTLPEVEDPYGGPNCICKCHKIEDEMYASRARHCIPCGTKFLQGRVYVQTGKGLRLANVTFNNSPNSDHIKRLSVKPIVRPKRKSETSPSKILMSPTKDDEPRHSNESEDDIENSQNKKRIKSFRTSSPTKSRKKPQNKIPKPAKKEISKIKPKTEIIKKGKKKKTEQSDVKKPETLEESTSKTEGIESENEVESMEESSQDTIESDDSLIVEIESENSDDESWKRDEDKVILQTFQQSGESENVFRDIQQHLPNRTEAEIKLRFQALMSLLQKMAT